MTLPLIAYLGFSACVHKIKAETWTLGVVTEPIKTVVQIDAKYGTPEWESETQRMVRGLGFAPIPKAQFRAGYAATRAARRRG